MIEIHPLFLFLLLYLLSDAVGYSLCPLHMQPLQWLEHCNYQLTTTITPSIRIRPKATLTRMNFARVNVLNDDEDDELDYNFDKTMGDGGTGVVEVSEGQLLEHWLSIGGKEEDFTSQTGLSSYIQSQMGFMDDNDDDWEVAAISANNKKQIKGKRSEKVRENRNMDDSGTDILRQMFENRDSGPVVDTLNQMSVGIDLGTSNSAISRIVDGEAQIIEIAGSRTIPSAVCYLPDDCVLVGKPAIQRRLVDPPNTFLSIKRVIGRKQNTLPKGLPYYIHLNETDQLGWKIRVPNLQKNLKPEEISAEVIKFLLDEASRSLNVVRSSITRAVITVPAYFTTEQCNATEKAGILAGLEKVKLLREPEAAAFAYGLTQRERQIVLVFDLGGGTFDVSVLDVGDGFAEVIATSGDSQLGGDDFDEVLVTWMIGQFIEEYPDTKLSQIKKNTDTMSRLYETAERVKVTLTNEKSCTIFVPCICDEKDLSCALSREKFESLTSKLLSRLLIPMREVALMSGINLAGESLNTDEEITELEDAVNSQGVANLSTLDDAEMSISKMKKVQQAGRKNAKMLKKVKSDFTREMNRLRSKTGDNNLAAFPGGYSLSDVILVGGATRMPAVQRLIQGLTGVKPRLTVNPDEAVSLGAAVLAGTLDGTLNNMQVMSSWQAALYRAFYENYNKENKGARELLTNNRDQENNGAANSQQSVDIVRANDKDFVDGGDIKMNTVSTKGNRISGKTRSAGGLLRRIKENRTKKGRHE